VANQFLSESNVDQIEGEDVNHFFVKDFEEVTKILKENYGLNLRKEMKKLKKGLIEIIKKFAKKQENSLNSFHQLFAIDFGITTKGKLYLLEFNAFPSIDEGNPKKDKIYKKMLRKYFERLSVKFQKTRGILKYLIEDIQGFSEEKGIKNYHKIDLI
jgi:hypothetical protein